jgi:hypothetical protein
MFIVMTITIMCQECVCMLGVSRIIFCPSEGHNSPQRDFPKAREIKIQCYLVLARAVSFSFIKIFVSVCFSTRHIHISIKVTLNDDEDDFFY